MRIWTSLSIWMRHIFAIFMHALHMLARYHPGSHCLDLRFTNYCAAVHPFCMLSMLLSLMADLQFRKLQSDFHRTFYSTTTQYRSARHALSSTPPSFPFIYFNTNHSWSNYYVKGSLELGLPGRSNFVVFLYFLHFFFYRVNRNPLTIKLLHRHPVRRRRRGRRLFTSTILWATGGG